MHSLSSFHCHRQNNSYTQIQIRNRTHFTLERQAITITSMQLTGIYLCTCYFHIHIFATHSNRHHLPIMINYLHTVRPFCLSYFPCFLSWTLLFRLSVLLLVLFLLIVSSEVINNYLSSINSDLYQQLTSTLPHFIILPSITFLFDFSIWHLFLVCSPNLYIP